MHSDFNTRSKQIVHSTIDWRKPNSMEKELVYQGWYKYFKQNHTLMWDIIAILFTTFFSVVLSLLAIVVLLYSSILGALVIGLFAFAAIKTTISTVKTSKLNKQRWWTLQNNTFYVYNCTLTNLSVANVTSGSYHTIDHYAHVDAIENNNKIVTNVEIPFHIGKQFEQKIGEANFAFLVLPGLLIQFGDKDVLFAIPLEQ